MNYAGPISGAALGYITADAYGAYVGYKLGEKLTQKHSMPKTRRTPSRSTPTLYTPTPGTTGRRRSSRFLAPPSSRASSSSSSRRMSTSSSGSLRPFRIINSVKSSGDVVAKATKVKGNKVRKEGRKKPIRVPKRLRKQIKQVLSNRGPVGIVKEIAPLDQIEFLVDNQQRWDFCTKMVIDGIQGWAFTPTYIMQLYDILWGKGAYGASFTTDRTIGGLPTPKPNMKIEVKEQYYIVKIKNLTARTISMCLMDISPKNVQEASYNTLQFIEGELTRTAPSGAAGSATQESRENPLNTVKETLGFSPKLISSFRNAYTMDETYVTLEPGKEYYHKVKGPNNKVYDINKYFKNTVYRPFQKFVKQTLIRYWPDLVTTDTGLQVGRFTEATNTKPYGLAIEVEYFTKLKCPDQAGFQTPAPALLAGAVQPITQQGYAWMIKTWYGAQEGVVVDIEDENPQDTAVTAPL